MTVSGENARSLPVGVVVRFRGVAVFSDERLALRALPLTLGTSVL